MLALAISFAGCAQQASQPPSKPSEPSEAPANAPAENPLPADVRAVLEAPETLEIYAVRGSMDLGGMPPPGSDTFHDNLVIGKAAVSEAAQRVRITAAATAGIDPEAPVAACFHPRHALRAMRNRTTVDLVICYECASLEVYVNDERIGSVPTRDVRASLDREFLALGVTPDPVKGARSAPAESNAATAQVSVPAAGEPSGADGGFQDDFMRKMYQARLIGSLQAGLKISGVGLPPEERAKLRVEARCTIDAKLNVLECLVTRPSGNAAFDLAVTKHLQSKKGLEVPPPPEGRPDLKPTQLTFRVACGPRCD